MAALLLVGCASTSVTESNELTPSSAVAVLDASTERIDYPIDNYSLSLSDLDTLERADAIRQQACLSEMGQPVDLVAHAVVRSYDGERPYGIWGMENAQVRGYEIPSTGTEPFDLGSQSADFNRAWDECGSKTISSANLGLQADDIGQRITAEAFYAAGQSPEWRKTIQEWKDCLAENDLEVAEDQEWVPDLSNATTPEARIRIAVTDIECKDRVSMVQRLANLEASFQGTLIDQHEAELVEQKNKIASRVKEAAAEIAEYNLP